MKTRIIHTKIWKDDYFATLNTAEKLLFVYFLTNEYVNIIHLYECPERVIMFDTGVSKEELDSAKNKFEATKKFRFHDSFVYIPNAYRYERYVGEKNDNAKQDLVRRLPKSVLDWFYSISDTPIYTPLIGTINHKSKIINDKPETINQKEEINKEERVGDYVFKDGRATKVN